MKVTIVLSEPLKEEFDAHAVEHSKLYEPAPGVAGSILSYAAIKIFSTAAQ